MQRNMEVNLDNSTPIQEPESQSVIEPATSGATTPEEGGSALHFWLDLIETAALALVLFLAINFFSARVRVDGHSMDPTLANGDYVLVYKLAYQKTLPNTGDIIVFHPPNDPPQEYIKRVIGRPGDQVVVAGGKVSVNGQVLNEPYILNRPNYRAEITVPAGTVFVLGDNRQNSQDSHEFGPVPLASIIGKAIVIYWPPSNWSAIRHYGVAMAAP